MWLCVQPPVFKQDMVCILCGLLAVCTGLAPFSEMGQELFYSCDLLYNKPEAFRSALDQPLFLQ